MSNNTTSSPSKNVSVLCILDVDKKPLDSYVCEVFLASSIIIATSSPVAVMGNAVILAAVWRKTFQRTPFHILLGGLAFTDLCTGLIVQPLIAASSFLHISYLKVATAQPELLRSITVIGNVSFLYFVTVTFCTMSLMAVGRWLHMSRRSLVTSRRGCLTLTVVLLVPIPLVVVQVVDFVKGKTGLELSITAYAVMLFCFLTTFVAYFKVFRIIRQHQQQVMGNESTQNFGQPAINLAKYKKSVVSILYILALFSFCFLPMIVSLAVILNLDYASETVAAFQLSLVALILSSSLNPCLYLWRMNDIRRGVKQLFCSNN